MTLYDRLPDTVIVNKRKIKVDLEFRNVLRMMDTLMREDLTPDAREYIALKCICKRPRKGMLPVVRKLLFTDDIQTEHKRITDYQQDADLIRGAFRQVYGIDLYRDKLHWFEFSCLISCLPQGNRYTDVLGIRGRPIPAPNKFNSAEREWLIKAKSEYALKLTEKEKEDQYAKSVANIGRFLMKLAGGDNE